MAQAGLSHNDIRAILCSALQQSAGKAADVSIQDVFSDRVIVCDYSARGPLCFYQRSYTIDPKTRAVTLGKAEQVQPTMHYQPISAATFSLGDADVSSEERDGLIIRTGKIFEIGDYPDKGFSIDADEAQAAIAAFSPVDIDIEHRSTPLDGKLGQLTGVALADDGKTITGSVAIPQWLDAALGDAGRKVSLTWDRATKTIRGLALTKTPRVADAALFAAFSAATGETIPTPSTVTEEPAPMEQQPHEQQEQPRKPGVAAFFARLLGREEQEIADAIEETLTPATFSQSDRDEIAALKSQLQTERQQRIETEAAQFADRMQDKITPAERAALIAAYSQAAQDDQQHGLVSFSDDRGQSAARSRVDGVKAIYTARPDHNLTKELVPDATGVVFATTDQQPSDTAAKAERMKKLAEKTPLGRAAISAE